MSERKVRSCKPRAPGHKPAETTGRLRSRARGHWVPSHEEEQTAPPRPQPGCGAAPGSLRSKVPRGATPTLRRGGGAPKLSLHSSRGEAGDRSPPKSRPLPALSWAARRAQRRRLVWTRRNRRPGPPGDPTPRCGRPRPPHPWGQLSWKILQPPQRGPLFRLHPWANLGPRSSGKARSLLSHVTPKGGDSCALVRTRRNTANPLLLRTFFCPVR